MQDAIIFQTKKTVICLSWLIFIEIELIFINDKKIFVGSNLTKIKI